MMEFFPERGQSGRVEPRHIASNECLWESVRQHHVEGLGEVDSRYQTDYAFEEEEVVLQVRLLTETSLS